VRERWARIVALMAGGLVVSLAVLFALRQNPPGNIEGSPEPGRNSGSPSRTAPAGEPPPAREPLAMIAKGKQAYADLACARCHSIGGQGGGRGSLDGIGSRLDEPELRAWVTPNPDGQDFRSRHARPVVDPAQRDALLAYLRSLR